jgi:hypothetical protein
VYVCEYLCSCWCGLCVSACVFVARRTRSRCVYVCVCVCVWVCVCVYIILCVAHVACPFTTSSSAEARSLPHLISSAPRRYLRERCRCVESVPATLRCRRPSPTCSVSRRSPRTCGGDVWRTGNWMDHADRRTDLCRRRACLPRVAGSTKWSPQRRARP